MPDDAGPDSALDRPSARLWAVGVVILIAAFIGYLHRDDLFPPEPAVVSTDPLALCFAARAADIDGLLVEGTITEAQAALFKERARALCQAQEGRQ